MSGHLNDDQLIDRLYGLASDRHTDECSECAQRLRELRERKAELSATKPVANDFLFAQRRKIYARLGEQPHTGMRWAPALAAACLLAVGMLFYRPAPVPHPDAADAQLFADVYSMEESTEPRAAAPIHALFEDNQ
jgi:hypothetical protein